MVNQKDCSRYIYFAIIAIVAYLSYLIIKPFITALLTSAVIAYIFYPLYEAVNKEMKNKSLSAFIISVIIILLLSVPFILLLSSVAKESQFLYVRSRQVFTTGDIFNIGCDSADNSTACTVSNVVGDFLREPEIRYHLENSTKSITTAVTQKASAFVLSVPNIVLNIFVTFFTLFYLFRDGKELVKKLKAVLPLKLHHQKQVIQQLDEVSFAIIYGSLLIALIQGGVGAIGFYFFGISSPLIWGIIMSIFALIPFIGTAIVWLPMSLVLVVQGITTNSDATILKGLGLLIYGALIISTIDNLLKPYIIGKRARIHPVLVLLGVLGGLAFFGFIGFIVGPLILAVVATIIEIYEKERKCKT